MILLETDKGIFSGWETRWDKLNIDVESLEDNAHLSIIYKVNKSFNNFIKVYVLQNGSCSNEMPSRQISG